jgi:hypothetical protein
MKNKTILRVILGVLAIFPLGLIAGIPGLCIKNTSPEKKNCD